MATGVGTGIGGSMSVYTVLWAEQKMIAAARPQCRCSSFVAHLQMAGIYAASTRSVGDRNEVQSRGYVRIFDEPEIIAHNTCRQVRI